MTIKGNVYLEIHQLYPGPLRIHSCYGDFQFLLDFCDKSVKMTFTPEQYERWDNFMKRMAAENTYTKSDDTDSLPDINEEEFCAICLDEILTDWLKLMCGHKFHRNCILEWTKKITAVLSAGKC